MSDKSIQTNFSKFLSNVAVYWQSYKPDLI